MARSDYIDLHIQIGKEVSKTEIALQDVVLVWDEVWSHGLVESIPVLQSIQQRLNTLHHVQTVVKQYGFTNY